MFESKLCIEVDDLSMYSQTEGNVTINKIMEARIKHTDLFVFSFILVQD